MSLVLSRLYFRMADLFRGTPVVRHLHAFERSQWNGPETLQAATAAALAEVLKAAWTDVPFYRERLWEPGKIRPETAFEALAAAPVLTRAQLFDHRDALRSRGEVGRTRRGRAGGAGGEALEFLLTRDFLARTEAAQWRGRAWWGMRRGDPMVALWGRDIMDRRMAERIARRERSRNWLRISALDLGQKDLAEHIRAIGSFRPEYIYGYGSAIYQLALFCSEHQLRLPAGIRAVFFTTDTLLGFQRRLVEETFRAPTAYEQGSCETGAFAFECREGGTHIAAENVHVEILRGDRPVAEGEDGEMAVTVLHNRAMPLIRYATGEWARLLGGRCACGRHLPRIAAAQVRMVDLVRTSRGRAASGHLFDLILMELIDRGIRGIRQFLAVQKGLDRFVIQVVPGPGLDPACLDVFDRRLREKLGRQIDVEFEIVPRIPPDPSGRMQCFRCDIAQPGASSAPAVEAHDALSLAGAALRPRGPTVNSQDP